MRAFHLALLFLLLPSSSYSANFSVFEPSTGVSLTIDDSGVYTIHSASLAWTFSGAIDHRVSSVTIYRDQKDALGTYHELSFEYTAQTRRRSSIRTYAARPVVLFATTYLEAADNADSDKFPIFRTYPILPHRLSHKGVFGRYRLDLEGQDSPWLVFDRNKDTFVLSPAANFMVTQTIFDISGNGRIMTGINDGISKLPAGFEHKTLLAFGRGINAVFDVWGDALRDLNGKKRVANDADVSLEKLGYWTDNGGRYYYQYEKELGYTGTLMAIKKEFEEAGFPLGYIQIDSWWYLKCDPPTWDSVGCGIWRYIPAPELFPHNLTAFRRDIGIPLIVHSRWVDSRSPYHNEYQMSANTIIDPRFWNELMPYLKESGVVSYEQDWLNENALPANTLTDGDTFLREMALAAGKQGITIQYCMPLPRHYLAATQFNEITTIRPSNDRLEPGKWSSFIYDSRLAHAVGLWPWADVFFSHETWNLLLATLSAGMVGVGDSLGELDVSNLRRVVRPDGVIVKPDVPAIPTDESLLQEAGWHGVDQPPPLVAATYSEHGYGVGKVAYVFTFARGNNQPPRADLSPALLGVGGKAAYVYNYFTGKYRLVQAGERYIEIVGDRGYYIVAPVGRSGIAVLGDLGKFVSAGKKRIESMIDNGKEVTLVVVFAEGESEVTVSGFAPSLPIVSVHGVSVLGKQRPKVEYDLKSGWFEIPIKAGKRGKVTVVISSARNKDGLGGLLLQELSRFIF